MASWNNSNRTLRIDIIYGISLAFLCIAVQHSSNLLSWAIALPIQFRENSDVTEWTADIGTLPVGSYYASIGRPRAPCELLLDGHAIDSTISEVPELRNGLLLGGGINVSKGSHFSNLKVRCQPQEGFFGDLTHVPVIASYGWGMLLQIWRGVTELLIGPLSSLLIVFSFVFRVQKERKYYELSHPRSSSGLLHFEGWEYLFYGLVAFFYSLSLAYYSRLFFPGMAASVLHVVLRNLFSFASLLIFTSVGVERNIVLLGQALMIALSLSWACFAPGTFVAFYKVEYLFIPLSTLLISYPYFRSEPMSKTVAVLRRVLVAWTLVQFLDTSLLWTGFGAYTAPSVVVLLSCSVFYLRELERKKTLGIETAVAKILTAVESKSSINEVFKEVCHITKEEAGYTRTSAYIDGFCIGAAESPGKVFCRIMEAGYRKGTARDAMVSFKDGRGVFMEMAHRSGKPISMLGNDSSWFIVVPIGAHAILNLSDDRPKSPFIAYESEEIIKRIFPSLRTLDRRLVELGVRQGVALQKVRSVRGDGKWEEEFGALFVDINDFSRYSDLYENAFTSFISEIYIPSLIKAVSQSAVPEYTAGDAIYFVVIRDIIVESGNIRSSVVKALTLIDAFVNQEGAGLCASSGFPSVTVSIGVTVGVGTIVSDSVSVRTAGKEVNYAKRLQEEAGKSGIIIKSDSGLTLDGTSFIYGEEIFIQQKNSSFAQEKLFGPPVKLSG